MSFQSGRAETKGKAPLWDVVKSWIERRERQRLRRRVRSALSLTPRGAVPDDRLPLRTLSTCLEVEWSARDVQPWDRDLPPERQTALFVEQCLNDTVAAIERIFDRMKEVDVIVVRVVDPRSSNPTVLAGTVSRHELGPRLRRLSPAMRLKLLGIRFRFADGEFEPLR